ncbi:MAG: hypothetical protein Q7K57_57160 [Burkholderiaceae bacterium]|nr:hypothetical protein [Burkholderiaceae bacterium]
MAMTEDLSAFFNAAEFASTVALNGVPVSGIFDSAYALGAVGPFGMASSQPTLTLPTASVPANPVGLPVVVTSYLVGLPVVLTSYLVAAHEPDGTGISRLLLELA